VEQRRGHGDHVSPKGPAVEQLACVVVPVLETMFGLATDRIWTWVKRQSRSPHDTLQNLFSDYGH
jgi:hypothetical protein